MNTCICQLEQGRIIGNDDEETDCICEPKQGSIFNEEYEKYECCLEDQCKDLKT